MRKELMQYRVALYIPVIKQTFVIKTNGDCEECELRPSTECTAPANILCGEMNGCWVYPAGARAKRDW